MLGAGLTSCMQDSDYNPMYMVPIRATRAARRAQLVSGEPTLTLIRRFMVQLSQRTSQPPQQTTTSKFGGWPADVLFRWLAATLHTRSLRAMPKAKRAFARILELSPEKLDSIEKSRDVNYERLRVSRTKYDLCWILSFRRFFAQMRYSCMWSNLYVDSSPQKRGQELYSASFEIINGGIAIFFAQNVSSNFHWRRLHDAAWLGGYITLGHISHHRARLSCYAHLS